VLDALAAGGVLATDDIRASVKSLLGLSDEDCAEMPPTSPTPTFRNLVAWAYVDLQGRGLVEKVSEKPNRYRLTDLGRLADPRNDAFEETFPKPPPTGMTESRDASVADSQNEPPPPPTPRIPGERRPFDPANVPPPAEAYSGFLDNARRLALTEQARLLHHQILCRLMSRLVEEGWSNIGEIPGDIDMIAEDPRGVTWFFEAKTVREENELSQTRSGFAQLMEYRVRFGSSQTPLCLVTDKAVSGSRVALLEALGVGVVVADGMAIRALNAPAAPISFSG
jgi:hypothetical protein